MNDDRQIERRKTMINNHYRNGRIVKTFRERVEELYMRKRMRRNTFDTLESSCITISGVLDDILLRTCPITWGMDDELNTTGEGITSFYYNLDPINYMNIEELMEEFERILDLIEENKDIGDIVDFYFQMDRVRRSYKILKKYLLKKVGV